MHRPWWNSKKWCGIAIAAPAAAAWVGLSRRERMHGVAG
jgi:hypothetical protein